jgi:hypothetical protein
VDWKPSDLTCVQPGRQDRRTRKLRPARYSRRNLPVARCCPRGQSPLKRAQSQPLPVRAGPVAATPFTPIASQRGFRGPATRTSTIRPALRWRDHERASRNQHPATSNALPLRAVEYALAIRTFATQPARQAPLHPQPVTLAASARCTSNVPPLRDHERPRTASFGRGYDAVVAPASLNPAGWHAYCNNWNAPCHFAPKKTKLVNGLLRAVGRRGFSYAPSAARVPTALKMLSQ